MRKAHLTGILVVLCLWLMAPGAALAGWYAGAGAGNTDSAQNFAFDFPPSSESDDSGLGWGVFGGYDFGPTFALEINYGDLGDDYEMINILGDDERIRMDVAEIDATVIGRIKVHDRTRFFGRLGLAFWDAELAYSEPGFSSSDSDTDFDAVLGLGFEWQVADILGIRFEWKQYQNVGDEVKTDLPSATGGRLQINGTDISILGVAAAFRIGS